MSIPRVIRRLAAGTWIVLATPFAPSAHANTLPPGPVMGHPADYVIVTPAAFAGEFQSLAKWKTRLGLPACVKTLESIQAEYPGGRDDAERVRMFLQDAHAQWGTHWVLLGGLPPFLPARRVHTTFFTGGTDFVSDLYFGALHGTWDADGDGIFGEGISASGPGDSVDLHVDVYVGRAPVRSAAEARDFVKKTLLVGFEPFAPAPHRMLLGAEVFFPAFWVPGQPITLDGADLAEQCAALVAGIPGVEVQRLYQNWMDPRWPGATDFTRGALLAALRAGTDFFLAEDRGGPLVMTAGLDSVTAADLAGLTDAVRPTQAWLVGSYCGNFDGDCLASAFVRGATGGAATCVAPSDIVFLSGSLPFQTGYVAALYPPNRRTVGEALALSKAPLIASSDYDGVYRDLEMDLNLLGDPETRLRFESAALLAVSFPPVVAAGPPGFDVDVTAAGVAVAGARVCAMLGDEALEIATTDGAGSAHLEFPAGSAGDADLIVTAPDGTGFSGSLVVGGVTAVGPASLAFSRLDRPEPNPAFANVRLSGAVASPAPLELFDVGGRRVRSFVVESGPFAVRWDLRDTGGHRVAPGLYLARLGAADGVQVQRLVVGR